MQNFKSISTEEKEWYNKQLGYRAEVKRWGNEVARQQKINDAYSTLSEGN
jgi:hypothetical protein